MLIIDREQVKHSLPMSTCIELVRQAMIALSLRESRQVPRNIIPLSKGGIGAMLGALGESRPFGAKIVAVGPKSHPEGQSHRGGVLLFDPDTYDPVALVHAGEITAIRTAAASAVATDSLARRNARIMAVLGCGEQAASHIRAIRLVRPIRLVRVWGRNLEGSRAFAQAFAREGVECVPARDVAEAVHDADIVCTTTAAQDPILFCSQVRPGTHLNVVGSSQAASSEIDIDLVRDSKFFVDHRPSALLEAGEFLRARKAGLVDDSHIVAEIGEILYGRVPFDRSDSDITIYKSLGQIVQDLATSWHVYRQALKTGLGTPVNF